MIMAKEAWKIIYDEIGYGNVDGGKGHMEDKVIWKLK